jgi:putative phosphoesterase
MSAKPEPLSCGADESYCKFGTERLAKLLEGFETQIGGVVKSEDIEYVHRMRVASRRLRATMPLFATCFPRKKFKRWLKEIKKVTKLLGEARDLDIQIQFIENYQSQNKEPATYSVAEHLLQSKKARRARIQPNVVQGLEELQESTILIRMQEFFENATTDHQNSVFNPAAVREKAYWAIAGRLDDFLAMEEYVYRESETLKLHEMRIRAKHLRYTLETFSLMYPNELTEEIETMKSFQDSLGEMHDCDVWTEYIAKSTARPKAKGAAKRKTKTLDEQRNQSLRAFLQYVKEQRKIHYTSFVELWENCQKNRFFEKLRETTNSGFPKAEDKIKELQANPEAEIAVLADIHANLQALQAVIEDAAKRGVRFFLNAGDTVGFGPCPNEAVELLHSKSVISVVGNFDREVLNNDQKAKNESKIALEFARKQISSQCSSYLQSLPQCIELEIAGKKLLLTHGTPEAIDEHIYHDMSPERLKKIADDTKADIIITGHSHDQYTRDVGGAIFINPGSVGRPGDGNPQAAYAVLKVNPFKVELVRIDYDVLAAADALRKCALPESFSQMLLRGVAVSTIVEQDRQRKKAITRNCRKVAQNCEDATRRYWQDTEHYEQVRKLSLRLFDELQSLHKLRRVERCWLECASILHDIGISKTAKAHNKKSMELILNDTSIVLPSTERRIIASITRYHRKGYPKKKHYNLKTLGPKNMQKILLLSGILRVADSLDYTHDAIVENLRVNIGPKKITVECTTSSDPTLEQQAFNKKKDLIEKTLNKRMMLTWKQPQR